MNIHLGIARPEVQFGEDLSTDKLIQEFFDRQYETMVLDHDGIECAVIHIEPPDAILLLDMDHW